ncbi:unnamed protein product [Phytophthora fragariaefolia]|uniref:Unnamed protein product n=1 Tax=Phytophthora fragariaefolia TaxID=1490495 RepID=A0A9W6TKB5_9STRA|nr:unnamed protein product [Phytophthora fragariaefolia]
MRVIHIVLSLVVTLTLLDDGICISAGDALTTESQSKALLVDTPSARKLGRADSSLEERGRRSGGGQRRQIHGTYTSIGFMYPNDTPYLKKDMKKFLAWLKRNKKKVENTESN